MRIFDKLQGVWNCGGTLSFVLDISSQSELKLRRKWKNKIVKNLWQLISDFQTLSWYLFTLDDYGHLFVIFVGSQNSDECFFFYIHRFVCSLDNIQKK